MEKGAMPQLILPLIPNGASRINDIVSVYRDESTWTYFLGSYPIHSHAASDQRMFRVVTSQMINSGTCRQVDIINAFGVSRSSVVRALRKYQEGGIEAFFKKRKGRRGGSIFTEDVLVKAQALFDQGFTRSDVAEELDIKPDTLRKAISDGRLREKNNKEMALTKSNRNEVDAEAAVFMGTACTRPGERVLASIGKCVGATVEFEVCFDVPNGGVLCALPALLANGLLNGVERMLGSLKGYYTTFHILLLIAFMALCRIKTIEKVRGYAPGEFGKLLGLDRIPEVRCLRNKLDDLSKGEAADQWAAHLSAHWMKAEPEAVGTLYIDGHVRVYHGSATKLPRRYVSRQRLCLRGTTDYWINDAIGRPFFVVEKVVDPGLLGVLRADIVPRLLAEVPAQPTEPELQADPWLSRFILVFDREGYSPGFFSQMWRDHRIACLSYHKYPGDPWPEEWFADYEAVMPHGEVINMKLCEMGSRVGSGSDMIWVREVRKLTESGHQTSIISTVFDLDITGVATRMFSRWCQENFFRYMMQHFDIDRVIEYGGMPFPDTEKVVNPAWRESNRRKASLSNKLRYRNAKLGALTIHPETADKPVQYEKWLKKKADLFEEITYMEQQLAELKINLKDTDKHITFQEMQEADKFHQLLPGRKRLVDTVRMIAYRAETAMVGALKSPTVDSADARQLLQSLFVTEADIIPDMNSKHLLVRVHNASRPAANRSLMQLFEYLNEAKIIYPGSDLRLVYQLGRGTKNENGVT
jgi:transposase